MGMTLLPVDWSLALNQWGAAAEGLAEGVDDVAQCVTVILSTPLRSDPHRPDFGCDLMPWIDRPVADATPGIVAAVRDALERWETRIELIDVTVAATAEPDGAGLVITVTWRLVGSIAAVSGTSVLVGGVRVGGLSA